jgi:putative two-component system response regulator
MSGGGERATPRLLVVDDERRNLDLLGTVLARAGYGDVTLVADPQEALDRFEAARPDLVLLDLHMPGLDGFEVLERLGALVGDDDFVPVVMLTADGARPARERALELGAHDFLTKPFDVTEVLLRVRNLLRTLHLHDRVRRHREILEDEVRERTADLAEARLELLQRLGLASEYRDDDTHHHTRRVGRNTARLAEALGLSREQARLLGEAAPLHDIGKIGVSDLTLLKPGALTDEERAQMRAHTTIGGRILAGSGSDVLHLGEEIARTHHERWDGSGYPAGLRGIEIPLSGRLVAVVDVFDALTHRRPYKPAWPVEAAVEELQKQRGGHFDGDVVDAFVRLVESRGADIEP